MDALRLLLLVAMASVSLAACTNIPMRGQGIPSDGMCYAGDGG
jgi:hypothetical protein